MPAATSTERITLTEGNFSSWASYIQDRCLTSGHLAWKCLNGSGWKEPTPKKPGDETDAELHHHDDWEKAQHTALGLICESISEKNKHLIAGKTAFEAWATLKKEHNAVTAERQYQLLQAFTAVRQRPDESLTDFLSRLQIAKDHILASMTVDAKASDLLDTLVTFFSLHHFEETKENDEMHRMLQRTTKITLNGVQDAFTTEQVTRETAAAAAK
ncbi:hypothetical protein FRB96_006641, partial [Tulasnella sp. 330]